MRTCFKTIFPFRDIHLKEEYALYLIRDYLVFIKINSQLVIVQWEFKSTSFPCQIAVTKTLNQFIK